MKIKIILYTVFIICLSNLLIAQNIGINTHNPQSNLDVKGDIIFRMDTLYLLDGANEDIDIMNSRSKNYIIKGPIGIFDIGGFNGGFDGKLITLYNSTPYAYNIISNSSGSFPRNQINTGTGLNLAMNSYSYATFQYLALDSLWHIENIYNDLSNASSSGQWSNSGNDIFNTNTGRVGVGKSSPSAKLDVLTDVTNETAVLATTQGEASIAVYGRAENGGFGVLGEAFNGYSVGGYFLTNGNTNTEFALKAETLNAGTAGYFSAPIGKAIVVNEGTVTIGSTEPNRAKLEVHGVIGSGSTSAIFGGEGTGLSFQRNWPTIGFNQYRDGPAGWGKAIASGYGMHMYLDPNNGTFALDMQDSVGKNSAFATAPIRALTAFKNGFIHIGKNYVTNEATLSISGSSNFPSHFNFGSAGHTYIRGGSNTSSLFGKPSKVYINDVPGYQLFTGNQVSGGDVIIALGGGKVGIGVETITHKLEVNGNIRSKEILVEAAPWPDYVFSENYHLKPLDEIEKYIKEHKHLPSIPASKEVESSGQKVGEIQRLMMEKIEELTLHIIELNKRIVNLENNRK